MRKERTSLQRWFQKGLLLGMGVVLLLVTGLMMPHLVVAETMYSYIDEHGTPVLTDNYNNIPERYRAKVKTIEQSVRQPSQTASFGAIQHMVTSWAKNITAPIGGFVPEISGLSPAQSKILTTAGLVALICVIAMYLIRNQAIKFITLWTLILTGIVTPVLMYTAQGGASDVMKAKATDAVKKQQDRLQQVP
ncbi:MAG TPA: hypothetical protein VIY67_03450 [Nitrospiraceae bacterium]